MTAKNKIRERVKMTLKGCDYDSASVSVKASTKTFLVSVEGIPSGEEFSACISSETAIIGMGFFTKFVDRHDGEGSFWILGSFTAATC